MNRLSEEMRPKAVRLRVPCTDSLIGDVSRELSLYAQSDPNRCWGYYPQAGLETEPSLPRSEYFSRVVPRITVDGMRLDFNFVRLSMARQPNNGSYHLDADTATGLAEHPSPADRRVWRLLVNLSATAVRAFSYLDVNPRDLELSHDRGYSGCPPEAITDARVQTLSLDTRRSIIASGVLFCASEVLHTGIDTDAGHFVAAYGAIETLPSVESA